MPSTGPIAVRLSRAFALRRSTMAQELSRATRGEVRPALAAYRLHPRELIFARTLLLEHTRLWVWRTHQQRRAGDFAIVDMSSPDPTRRTVWVVDLKLGAPLKVGGGGAGIQLTNAPSAVDRLVANGVVGREAPVVLATGGVEALVSALAGR